MPTSQAGLSGSTRAGIQRDVATSKIFLVGTNARFVDLPEPGGPTWRTRPDTGSAAGGSGGATACNANIGFTSQYTNAKQAANSTTTVASSHSTMTTAATGHSPLSMGDV